MMTYSLTYQKTLWKNYQWMVFFEFSALDGIDWSMTEKDILNLIIGTNIYNENLNPVGFESNKSELFIDGIFRPFNFNNLKSDDFQYLKDKYEFNNKLVELENEDDWETDLNDFRELKFETIAEIEKVTNFETGLWFIKKNQFKENDNKLSEVNWIFTYYLSFIEIDKNCKKIRTLEIGYD